MNNDLISREALRKALKSNCKPELCHDYNTAWCESCCRTNDFEDLIDNAPTVLHDNYSMGYQDGVRKVLSERPQGDWIIKDEVICECSLCGYSTNYIRLLSPKRSGLNYCAYCGAKMERSNNEWDN